MELIIGNDLRLIYKDIEAALEISSPSASTIVHNQLRVKKISSRRVPHSLTEERKCTWVEWTTRMMECFTNGDFWQVPGIVTGDNPEAYTSITLKPNVNLRSGSSQMISLHPKSRDV